MRSGSPLLAHPGPLGEGWTACNDKERQAPPVNLSMGVGMRNAMPRHPSPSSTAPEGLDTMVAPSAAYRYHHHPAPNSMASRRQGLLSCGPELVHSQHMALLPSLSFISGPCMSQGRNMDYVGGDGEVDFSDADNGMPDPSPSFTVMMDFVYQTFSKAPGQALQDSAPLLLGMQRREVPATTPSLRWDSPSIS